MSSCLAIRSSTSCADAALGPGIGRPHRRLPGLALIIGQVMQRGLAGGLDLGKRVDVFLMRDRVGVVGRLVHRLGQLAADVGRQPVPELGVHDHRVLQVRVVGDGDVLLHLVELLRQVVRRRVLAAVDHAGLQRLIDFRERHDLRDRAEVAEIPVGDLGAGDADLQALEIGRHSAAAGWPRPCGSRCPNRRGR